MTEDEFIRGYEIFADLSCCLPYEHKAYSKWCKWVVENDARDEVTKGYPKAILTDDELRKLWRIKNSPLINALK